MQSNTTAAPTVPTVASTPKVNVAKNSFVKSAAEIRRGAFITEASEKLAELTQAVMKTGKSGSMTITIKMRRNADGESIELTDNINAKIPKKDTPSTNFFAGDNGELLRDHPKQQEMFKVVEGGDQSEAAPIAMATPAAQPIPLAKPGVGGEAFPLKTVVNE